ncbi:MAG: hypothetical protein Q8859_03745 [Bacteroidota bacterium]|nr:hypothetical protein [Bacteroidota bacterium]
MYFNEWIVIFLIALIPSGLLFWAFSSMIKAFMKREHQIRIQEQRALNAKEMNAVRLQAYERLVLFLERMAPDSLLIRVGGNNITARQLQESLVETIRAEYEHNFTQQLYVSEKTWMLIRAARESMLRLINTAMDEIPPQSTGKELSRKVLELYLDVEESPLQVAIEALKKDVRTLF